MGCSPRRRRRVASWMWHCSQHDVLCSSWTRTMLKSRGPASFDSLVLEPEPGRPHSPSCSPDSPCGLQLLSLLFPMAFVLLRRSAHTHLIASSRNPTHLQHIASFPQQHGALHSEFPHTSSAARTTPFLPFATARRLISHMGLGISPRTPSGTVFTPHVSFPPARMAHAHPAIQRDRQSARPFLVVPQPPGSPQVEPLGFPPRPWALQALPISGRGAEMVG